VAVESAPWVQAAVQLEPQSAVEPEELVGPEPMLSVPWPDRVVPSEPTAEPPPAPL
jgi:hypothetical protein